MALTIQEWLKRPAYGTWLAVGIACRTDVSLHKSAFGKFIYLYSYGNQESKNKKGYFHALYSNKWYYAVGIEKILIEAALYIKAQWI